MEFLNCKIVKVFKLFPTTRHTKKKGLKIDFLLLFEAKEGMYVV